MLESVQMKDADKAIIDRFKQHIARPPLGSKIYTVTPVAAEWILNNLNDGNRPRKPANIVRYAEDMKAGRWGVTGDTLKFSTANRLRDGQNRLAACVRSGVTFETHVVFGVDDDLFDIMDRGKPRDGGDVLAIAGFSNYRVLSAGARWTKLLLTDPKSRRAYEPKEILKMVQGELADVDQHTSAARKIAIGTRQPEGIVTAILTLTHRADPKLARQFADAWEVGSYQGRAAPLALLDQEIRSIDQMSNGRVHDTVRAALIVLAWNLFYENKRGRKSAFHWYPADDFPAIAGLPVAKDDDDDLFGGDEDDNLSDL